MEKVETKTSSTSMGLSAQIAQLVDPSLSNEQYIDHFASIASSFCQALEVAVVRATKPGELCLDRSGGDEAFWNEHLSAANTSQLIQLSLRRHGVTVGHRVPFKVRNAKDQKFAAPESHVVEAELLSIPLLHGVSAPTVVLICSPLRPSAERLRLLDFLTSIMLTSENRGKRSETANLSLLLKQKEVDLADTQEQLKTRIESLQLANRVSGISDLDKLAYELANLLKSYFGSEKVSVLSATGKTWKMLSLSGQANFDNRSNAVRAVEKMASKLVQAETVVFSDGQLDGFSESLRPTIERFLQETLAIGFCLLPIVKRSSPLFPADEERLVELVNPGRTDQTVVTGCILIESLTETKPKESILEKWNLIEPAVSGSFNSSKLHSESVLRPVIDKANKFVALYRGHTKRKAVGITAAILLPLILAALIPTTFRIRCEGYLQPKNVSNVYSPRQAFVKDVFVNEGDFVKKGTTLVRFQDISLETELAREEGKLRGIESKTESVNHQRILRKPTSPESAESGSTLSEEAASLHAQLKSQLKLVESLRTAKRELVVQAPFDGTVMGWNLDKKLRSRPLERGVKLFSIYPSEVGYQLDLKITDKRSGYVQQAAAEKTEELAVEFSFASFPSQSYQARVVKIFPGLESDSDFGYVLPVVAALETELPTGIRAGLPVVAKINCGRRSFLYCKTFEFSDWLRRASFEYLY